MAHLEMLNGPNRGDKCINLILIQSGLDMVLSITIISKMEQAWSHAYIYNFMF